VGEEAYSKIGLRFSPRQINFQVSKLYDIIGNVTQLN
jgi:hypothetical protein